MSACEDTGDAGGVAELLIIGKPLSLFVCAAIIGDLGWGACIDTFTPGTPLACNVESKGGSLFCMFACGKLGDEEDEEERAEEGEAKEGEWSDCGRGSIMGILGSGAPVCIGFSFTPEEEEEELEELEE